MPHIFKCKFQQQTYSISGHTAVPMITLPSIKGKITMMGAMIEFAQCINLKEKKKQIKAILGRKECETNFFFK